MRYDIRTEDDAFDLQEKAVSSLEDKFEKYGFLNESNVHDTLLLNEATDSDPRFDWGGKSPSSSVGMPKLGQFDKEDFPYYVDNEQTMGFDLDEEANKIYYFGSDVRTTGDDIYKPLPGEVPGFLPELPHPDKFLEVWKDFDNYPRKEDVASYFGIGERSITNYMSKYRVAGYEIPNRDSLARGRTTSGASGGSAKKDIYTGPGRTGRTRRIGSFPGEFYRDSSRIKRSARKSWLKSFTLKPNMKNWIKNNTMYSNKLFIKIFLFGYEMDMGDIVYELWYNPYENTYVIYDQYANLQGRSYYTMQDAVEGYLNFIATEDIKINPDDIDTRDKVMVQKNALRSVEDANDKEKRQKQNQEESLWISDTILSEKTDFVGFSDSIEPDTLRQNLLNENQALTSMFTDIIRNEMIEEYDKTRVRKHKMGKRIWQKYRDGKVEFPPPSSRSKTMRFILTIRNKPQLEGTFVKGFSFKGGGGDIDLEIWYMRENPRSDEEKTYFQIFNLSGLKSEGTADTVRGAYQIVKRKLSL